MKTATKIRVEDRSLYARPDGGRLARYVVTFEGIDGTRRRLKTTFHTKKEAKAAARDMFSAQKMADLRKLPPLDGSVKLCPICGVLAVEELTDALKRVQPDGTTHVCHPIYGGCNRGYGR